MRLSHAYIVDSVLTENLAMAAVCSGSGDKPCLSCVQCKKASRKIHPDIAMVERLPDKREIVVDQIREIKKDVIVVPCESQKKVYVIVDADLMNNNAQNAFLQVLEEPPSHAVFILQTENAAQLLPTVRSRCIELKSGHEPDLADSAVSGMVDEFYNALDNGNLELAAFMFRLEKLDKGAFADFLSTARERSILKLRAGAGSGSQGGRIKRETLSHCEQLLCKAGEMLDLNVNTGHIAGMICAALMV